MKSNMNKNRDSFVFYRSYFEAIETLSKKNKLIAYEAIMRYALYGEVSENLPSRVLAILKMAQPNIDSSYKKYLNKAKNKERKNRDSFEEELVDSVQLPEKEENVGKNEDSIENNESDEFED